jgi:hypothetical protein
MALPTMQLRMKYCILRDIFAISSANFHMFKLQLTAGDFEREFNASTEREGPKDQIEQVFRNAMDTTSFI